MSAADPQPASRPLTQRFHRSSRAPALSADQKRRQARITDAAWRAFRAGAATAAFLNADDPLLGGRRLDLAIDSEDGLAAVLAALGALAAPPSSTPLKPGA